MHILRGSRARRGTVALTALGAMVFSAASAVSAPSAGAAPSPKPAKQSQIGKHDRELLATAKAKGASTVTLLIAAADGDNSSVIAGLQALGAVVQTSDTDVSYIRAKVPTSKVEAAGNLAGVVAADLDEVIPLDKPEPAGTQVPTPQTPPSAATPRDNPYMPIRETGAAAFTAAHPTWDGRGVTIGIVDSGIDLDHPALATTTTGERKITDWVTYTDPLTDDDPTWLVMNTQVSGPAFIFDGVAYAAPNGDYRVAMFDESDPRLGGELGNDVNRDGDSTDKFAVLWDDQTGKVRVDTNQNRNFRDDTPMKDFTKTQDIGHFGTDNPATDVHESMPFVIQTDKANNAVNIGIVSGEHGTHVAGITAANNMFGGAMSGAAPGAKLKSVRVCLFISGCTTHALIEGMTYIAKKGNVDVINMSIGGLPALNDGNNTRAVLYDRLIDKYKVQMFISAGNNGPGLNTIGDPAVASKVLAVGSYISRETWQKNYGSDSTFTDNLHPFSSRGPREDGGFKPEIVAPGAAISSTPMWEASSPVAGTYTLPAGYSMLQGTSMASPQAAGVGALLVSAALQAGVSSQPDQIRQALRSSARYLPRYGAYEQGNGLIDVNAAWNLLKRDIKTVDIDSAVEVHTILSSFLATPGVGQGIYDREGVAAGDSYTRTYTFTRTSGGAGTKTYNLSWTGNDGTFSTAGSIALPKNVASHPAGHGEPDQRRHPLGDPEPRRPGKPRHREADAEHGGGGRAVQRGQQLLGHALGHHRAQPVHHLLLQRPGERAGAEGGHGGRRRHPGRRPDPVPAVPPVRGRPGGQLLAQLLHPVLRLVCGRFAQQPYPEQPAGGCLGGDGRGPAYLRHGERAVQPDRLDPGRDGLAEPGHHRLGDDRHADQP